MKLNYLLTFILLSISVHSLAFERPNPSFDINDPALKRCIIKAVKKREPSKSDLLSVKYLDCVSVSLSPEPESKIIKSLDGLEGWTHLKGIKIKVAPSINLDELNNLRGLEFLHVIGNSDIKDFKLKNNFSFKDISGLLNLNKLIMENIGLTDISHINKLTKLKDVYLNDNQISDITPLKGMDQLRTFEASNNLISDMHVISTLNIGFINLSRNEIKTIPIYKYNTNEPIKYVSASFSGNPNNNCPNEDNVLKRLYCDVTYTPFFAFYDLKLLACLKEHFDVSKASEVTVEQFNNVTSINCSGRGIKYIEGLQNWGQLIEIDFTDNLIKDITVLKDLINLKVIQFSLNDISDLAALNYIDDLDYAYFEYNKITSLESIYFRGEYRPYSFKHKKIFLSGNDPEICNFKKHIIFDRISCE